jgi:hypothetical protein
VQFLLSEKLQQNKPEKARCASYFRVICGKNGKFILSGEFPGYKRMPERNLATPKLVFIFSA